MSMTNEPRRSSGHGGRRLEQNQSPRRRTREPAESGNAPRRQGGSAPARKTKKRPLAATIAIRLLQLLGTLILIGAVTGVCLAGYAAAYVKTAILPNTKLDLSDYMRDENSVIYYLDKDTNTYKELVTLHGEKNTEWVDFEDIPKDLINAFVAIEDKTFWDHNGINWRRTGGAVLNMFFSMSDTYGGSTITQQLIKNVTQYDDVTVKRKIQEIFTALELEKNYSKEDILELYLNIIYLGGNNCYGVRSAAEYYFGKDISELSLAECASLAGITNNPSLYSPSSTIEVMRYQCDECGKWVTNLVDTCEKCGAKDSYNTSRMWYAADWNKARQETILAEMAKEENGYITQAEYDAAVAENLVFVNGGTISDDGIEDDGNVYTWYEETVISEVIADLMEETGLDRKVVSTMVYSGGLSIYTNFDPDVQAAVDEVYQNRENLDKVSKNGQQIKSAITIVDNSTGYVVAIAGDVGVKQKSRILNFATSNFQPGSSFKPLSVYASALEMGLITPGTVIDDNPLLLDNGGDGTIWPRNDGASYKGLTTVKSGLAKSLNTIAVRTLSLVTPEASYQFLTERFGITTLVESMTLKNGQVKSDIDMSPLAMGGLTKGVSTYEMAAAFAAFPRNGVYTEPTTYLRVEDIDHNVILDNTPRSEQVIKESTAFYMNDMLTYAVQSGTGTPAKISGMTVAGKTGTTNDSYARWFAGYTPYYTGVVWVGYEYNEEITGFKKNPAVVMWQKVMSILHEDLADTGFTTTVETVKESICMDCGKLAVSGVCDHDSRELYSGTDGNRVTTITYVKGDEPVEFCTCHVPITVCTDSPILDAEGNATDHYCLAGEFCPEECQKTVYVVDFARELVTEPAEIGDYPYLKAYYDDLGNPVCTVHNGVVDPDSGTDDDPWWNWDNWDWPWTTPGDDEEDVPTLPSDPSPSPSSPDEPSEPSQDPEDDGWDWPWSN